ncbi:MAG: pyridoxamine 5'-phosphate oxidase family protein [Thermoleophilaceae bacterium]
MSLAELPAWARDLLDDSRVARLAFLDDGGLPRVLPVTYALAEGAVWSAIDQKPKRSSEPARLRYLRRMPKAALCVDRYEDDWEQLAWVQLLGRVDLFEPAAATAGLEALVAKYAPYRESRPGGPLLRLGVQRALHWRAAG